MKKKKIVIALGHDALGTTLPEQHEATKHTAKAVADFIRDDYEVVITHSNGPQVGMIHTAMSEFCRIYPEYTATPTAVCSAMSQGYIGYIYRMLSVQSFLAEEFTRPFQQYLHRWLLTHMMRLFIIRQRLSAVL